MDLKKTMIVFEALCLLLTVSVSGYKMGAKATGSVIYVPTDFAKIQDAINFANPGDTIFVHSGTYFERLFINKSLSLIGEDRRSTIVDGSGINTTVVIYNVSNVTLEGFTVRNGGPTSTDSGIRVEQSSNVLITQNNITGNANGVSLYVSGSNTISNNTILSNSNYGVYLSSSSGNHVSDNVVIDNDVGISVFSSRDNVISANLASENHYGLYFLSSIYNMLSGNNVSYNTLAGIDLISYSFNNTLYRNNMYDLVQASIDSANFWGLNGEGNYWKAYGGYDLNGDGIGDQPYVIDENNKDNYPLMGPFHDFPVNLKGQVYHVALISNSTVLDFGFGFGTETGNKIIHFTVTDDGSTVGFCRITIPIDFMSYPYILLVGNEEVTPTLLNGTSPTLALLYFTYVNRNQSVIIISSEALRLYNQLLSDFLMLQTDFLNLNVTFLSLSYNFTVLLDNYNKLQSSLSELNATYYQLFASDQQLQASFYGLNASYYEVVGNFSRLQADFDSLNTMYYSVLDNYTTLAGNYSQLQNNLSELNASYDQLLSSHQELNTTYSQLQRSFADLNASYQGLASLNATYYSFLNSFDSLVSNYSQLQENYRQLNASYQTYLASYAENARNIQNLINIFVATTAIFIISTIYLSKRAHSGATTKNKPGQDRK